MIVQNILRKDKCEAKCFVNDQARGVYPRGHPLPQCSSTALYLVEGKPYCKRHAMMVVFDQALKDNGAM